MKNIKKIVTVIAFLTFFSNLSFAQNDFRFGFQISPSFSWLASDDNMINGNGSNLGLKVGMVGEYYFRENYALVGGLGIAFNYGGTLKHDQGGNFWSKSDLSSDELYDLPDGVNLKYSMQYIEIPLGLKMRTNEFGYIRYFAEIPRFTIGINSSARGDISSAGSLDIDKENIKKDVNFLNFSVGLGGGIEYTINEGTTLVGGLFFQSGILDLTDDGATQADGNREDSKGTFNAITIRLGVIF